MNVVGTGLTLRACPQFSISREALLGENGRNLKEFELGERGELMLFLFPFLLACTFFAIAMSFFSREREMPFLIFVFTSVPLMFISGISWPKSAIPEYWVWFGKLFPSSFGIDGFVKINNTGATLSEVLPEFWGLCILMVFYFIVACLLYKRECKKLKINMV